MIKVLITSKDNPLEESNVQVELGTLKSQHLTLIWGIKQSAGMQREAECMEKKLKESKR